MRKISQISTSNDSGYNEKHGSGSLNDVNEIVVKSYVSLNGKHISTKKIIYNKNVTNKWPMCIMERYYSVLAMILITINSTISFADAVEQSEENDEKSEEKTTTFLTPHGSE